MYKQAIAFATAAHEGQVRKYTGEPYITHPLAVAELVATVTNNRDMFCAAVLHDVIEDTCFTFNDLVKEFGITVAIVVSDLTDISTVYDGNRSYRKSIDRAHTANATPEAKTIKLADLIHNTESIVKYDPNFAKVYMVEKKLLLEVLKEGDPHLYMRATHLVEDYFKDN